MKRFFWLLFSSLEPLVNLVGQRPIAMASDGHSLVFVGTDTDILSVQIGDSGSRQMLSIMKLNASSAGVRYYMAFDPVVRALYVSLPIEKRVVRIRLDREGIVDEILPNFVGNGKSCLQRNPGTEACGDGGAAGKAMLTYPKVRRVKTIFFRGLAWKCGEMAENHECHLYNSNQFNE